MTRTKSAQLRPDKKIELSSPEGDRAHNAPLLRAGLLFVLGFCHRKALSPQRRHLPNLSRLSRIQQRPLPSAVVHLGPVHATPHHRIERATGVDRLPDGARARQEIDRGDVAAELGLVRQTKPSGQSAFTAARMAIPCGTRGRQPGPTTWRCTHRSTRPNLISSTIGPRQRDHLPFHAQNHHRAAQPGRGVEAATAETVRRRRNLRLAPRTAPFWR
jgi:hypothetical protein